jgi:hypothetical protein
MNSKIVQRLLACLLIFTGSGCSRSNRSVDRYLPSKSAAQHALEVALTAWQQDAPIEKQSPAIQISDSSRKRDQRLQRFEILGEVPGDSPRCLAVRLNFDNPPEERVVRYVVIGVDPLWVFSYDDFIMLTHWDMNMTEEARQTKRLSKR